jgi:hypothetical protein
MENYATCVEIYKIRANSVDIIDVRGCNFSIAFAHLTGCHCCHFACERNSQTHSCQKFSLNWKTDLNESFGWNFGKKYSLSPSHIFTCLNASCAFSSNCDYILLFFMKLLWKPSDVYILLSKSFAKFHIIF